MKKFKEIISSTCVIVLVLMAVFSAVPINVVRAQTPRIYVDPATVTFDKPPATFNITIMVADVSSDQGVSGWGFSLKFDFSLLYTEESWIWEGDFLSNVGPTSFVKSIVPAESAWSAACALLAPVTASGSGSLAKIQFSVQDTGKTSLDLYDTKLRDIDVYPIDHTVEDGFFKTVDLHDIAITQVKVISSIIRPGETASIDVTVVNQGSTGEYFNVTVYYNSTAILTKKVNDLSPNTLTTLTFNWDTTGVSPGKCIISATAEGVPGETDTADNSMTDGIIRIKFPSDVDGDGDVDLDDLMFIARAFGFDSTYPPGIDWNEWNPDCDINNDGKVTAYDLYITGKNFGRTGG